jgi:hypothetical protein
VLLSGVGEVDALTSGSGLAVGEITGAGSIISGEPASSSASVGARVEMATAKSPNETNLALKRTKRFDE